MNQSPCILFTAFEPSGDDHAAPVIAHLRRLLPEVPIYALGGPKMARAGAELIETTTERAAMGVSAIAQVQSHRQRLNRLKTWIDAHPVAVHVPTDSPAANWAICKLVKRRWAGRENLGRVVHLVAPQVWAWASWRVRRLVKWSDLVLCLLPFEPTWFEPRGVRARFVGHPLFDHPLDEMNLDRMAEAYPQEGRRLALLPGSRAGEIVKNWPILLEVFNRLTGQVTGLRGVVAAVDERAADRLRAMTPSWPENLHIATRQADAVLRWSEVALVVSGTATLHVARHRKPMTVVYKVNPAAWHGLGRWLIGTRTFTLPNLISESAWGERAVREFVPFWGDPAPVADETKRLLTDDDYRQRQIDDLRRVLDQFAGHHAGPEAAEAIVSVLRGA